MFSNNKPNGEMSIEEIKARLKPIFVEIRLLQHSCDMVNFPWMMPEKFRGLSLDQLQDKHRTLISEMHKLPTAKLPDDEFNEVKQAAENEAARLIEPKRADVDMIRTELEISNLESERTRLDTELAHRAISSRPRW